jgi:hypothetical protein
VTKNATAAPDVTKAQVRHIVGAMDTSGRDVYIFRARQSQHWRKNMRRCVIAVLGLGLLISAVPLFAESNAAVERALQSKEQAGWQAWKDHDQKAFEEMIPQDAINIAGGNMDKGKQQIMKSAFEPGCQVASFSLSNFSYMWLDKDTVLMTYDAMQDATCGGQKVPGKVYASSVWQKKGGKWWSPFHQETAAAGGM